MISSNGVWKMFFNSASRTCSKSKIVARVGVIFVSVENHILPRVFSLSEPCSNNVTKYNALLIGLQLAQQMGVQYLEAYGDSKLIVNQIIGEYKVCPEDLIPYHHATIQTLCYISHVSRLQNTKADAICASSYIGFTC